MKDEKNCLDKTRYTKEEHESRQVVILSTRRPIEIFFPSIDCRPPPLLLPVELFFLPRSITLHLFSPFPLFIHILIETQFVCEKH